MIKKLTVSLLLVTSVLTATMRLDARDQGIVLRYGDGPDKCDTLGARDVWVFWSRDLNHWDPAKKAIVLDGQNCSWSKKCIGWPSVVQVGNRLAIFYDAPGGNRTSHMNPHSPYKSCKTF